MEKTKLGIPVTVLAAAAWLLGLYSGYLLTGILLGYVLLMEESAWLKKQCVKVLLALLTFSVISTALGLIPDLLHILYSFLEIFDVHFYLGFVHDVLNFLGQIVSLVKVLLFLGLGIAALLNKQIKLPAVDKLIDKYLD